MKTSLSLLLITIAISSITACMNSRQQEDGAFKPDMPYTPVKIPENTEHPGYAVYMKSCYKCHQQADPISLSVEKWKNAVPSMAKHAGISGDDGQKVLDYILHVKSQGVR